MNEFGLERLDERALSSWDELAVALQAPPFLRPGWVLSWTSAFAPTKSLYLATVRRDGQLVAVLPMLRHGGALHCVANAETPIVDLVAADDAAAWLLLSGILRQGVRHVELAFMPGPTAGLLRDGARRHGQEMLWRSMRRQPYVNVDGGWEAYESQHLGGGRRRDIHRSWRRLGEAGAAVLEVHDGRNGFGRMLHEGFEVESHGWKARAGTAILSQRPMAVFYASMSRWAAELGLLRLVFLRVDGRPLAFCLALEQHNTWYALKMGYDERYSRFSPGILLLHGMLREAFEQSHLTRVELLGQDEKYKMVLAHGCAEQHSVRIFQSAFLGRMDRMALNAGIGMRKILREQLPDSARSRLWTSANACRAAIAHRARR